MRWGRLLLVFVLLAGFGLFVARGAAPARAGATHVVKMTADNTFNPASQGVPVGDSAVWHNDSTSQHSILFDDDPNSEDAVVVEPNTDSPSFDTDPQNDHPGDVYGYHCTIHQGMTGSLTIQEAAPTTTTTSTTALSGFTTTTQAGTPAPTATTATTRHTSTTARHTTITRKATATTTSSTALTTTTTTEASTTTTFANFTTSSSTPQLAIKQAGSHRDNTPLIIGIVVAVAALGLGAFVVAHRFRTGGDGLWR